MCDRTSSDLAGVDARRNQRCSSKLLPSPKVAIPPAASLDPASFLEASLVAVVLAAGAARAHAGAGGETRWHWRGSTPGAARAHAGAGGTLGARAPKVSGGAARARAGAAGTAGAVNANGGGPRSPVWSTIGSMAGSLRHPKARPEDLPRPGDRGLTGLCLDCGFPGPHNGFIDCVAALRDRIAVLEFRLSAARRLGSWVRPW
jgi:hypothetical protein